MGNKICKKGFCAICAKRKKQKAKEATAEVSDTPSATQTSVEALAWTENQSPPQTMEVSEQDNDETQTMTQTTKEIGEAWPAADALQETEAQNAGKSRGENGRAQPTAQVAEVMGAKLIGKETLWYPAELQPAAGAVQEAENEPTPETTGEAEVLSAGEAEATEQVTEEAPQDTESHTAAETTQDSSEAVAVGRRPCAWFMEDTNGAPLAVEFLPENGIRNAAQATKETEAARDSETRPLEEMSESLTGKTEPLFAAQITEESETCPNAEHMQDTNVGQCSAQTGKLTVEDQFVQARDETGSQANIQAVQESIPDFVSAETKQVTPENAVQSILQGTSMGSIVCTVPEKNALESASHPSDATRQEKQPAVQVTQKITELKNIQHQQSVNHPSVLGTLTGDGASITTQQDQALELETAAVTVPEQKQAREKLSLQEKVPNSIAGTDAPVNAVFGRQEVDSQVLEASVPEMHKSRGDETANAETLLALETWGSEGEVIPKSGPRSSNNDAALASGGSQPTEAADALCVCRSQSPSRKANFICCCSN